MFHITLKQNAGVACILKHHRLKIDDRWMLSNQNHVFHNFQLFNRCWWYLKFDKHKVLEKSSSVQNYQMNQYRYQTQNKHRYGWHCPGQIFFQKRLFLSTSCIAPPASISFLVKHVQGSRENKFLSTISTFYVALLSEKLCPEHCIAH